MARKKFVEDIENARADTSLTDIHGIERGDDDGSFTFVITHPQLFEPLRITAVIPDVSEYPSSHTCMLYTDDEADLEVSQIVGDASPKATGKTILETFDCLRNAMAKIGQERGDDSDQEDEFDIDFDLTRNPSDSSPGPHKAGHLMPAAKANRIKLDLRTVKSAGFRVAVLGSPFREGATCIVAISCKIKKLGISHEAMRSWQISPGEYLVLLVRYPMGYKTAAELCTDTNDDATTYDVRLRICDTYKPPHQEALDAFLPSTRDFDGVEAAKVMSHSRDTFISGTINKLMTSRLVSLIRSRKLGMTWYGAEKYFSHNQGRAARDQRSTWSAEYYVSEKVKTDYPDLVDADHLKGKSTYDEMSFPLAAMQYALRHFVRCTEFCLSCHKHLPDDMEALRPYVCSDPLCLYQYMTLGFGPGIDHEILSQPLVTDLLTSFCYLSAVGHVLKEFPDGLNITLPPGYSDFVRFRARYAPSSLTIFPQSFRVKLELNSRKMVVVDSANCPFKVGEWIVCHYSTDEHGPYHCRVVETTDFPVINLGPLHRVKEPGHGDPRLGTAQDRGLDLGTLTPTGMPVSTNGPVWMELMAQNYTKDFDSLSMEQKRVAIRFLLDTLPDVIEMRKYLQQAPRNSLQTWHDRISPSALTVLRWIIASNRACIVQVDDLNLGVGNDIPALSAKTAQGGSDKEERVYGMKGWMQFKFAMGAPDKERRFMKEVSLAAKRVNTKYPTIFAWHGSALSNWHSIIRHGLNYDKIVNGRAFGNGVYHSQLYATSLGYCHGMGYGARTDWASSLLHISMAMSLNELVNAPREYTSCRPHLVVQHLDWIQTRYLFVRLRSKQFSAVEDTKPINILQQDPDRTPTGEASQLVLPASATKTRLVTPMKKRKRGAGFLNNMVTRGTGSRDDPMELDSEGDRSSIPTDDEDRNALLDVEDMVTGGAARRGSPKAEEVKEIDLFSRTRFRPGQLNFEDLPVMPDPEYANPTTTKRLQVDFRSIIQLQSTTPAHELGWYVEPDSVNNLYQWIVQMHSFDQVTMPGPGGTEVPLPLATDMAAANINSIVLELRFGPNYPFSPPFVRVIRPRFLGFAHGGGGHVTLGGALCMQLLTNTGWSSVGTMESVLLQVRLALSSTEPRPARLLLRGDRGGVMFPEDYAMGEAVEAFRRACAAHGWEVPDDIKALVEEVGVPFSF